MSVQLEFNLDNKSPEEVKEAIMQKQIDEACESMDKVRRKLFAELGQLKKEWAQLKQENEELKKDMGVLKNQKIEWTYGQNGLLFGIKDYHRDSIIQIESQS